MSVIIKDIQKNSTEIIRIEVSEFKGRELINIRIWYLSQDAASGTMIYKPTQKGIALSLSEFAGLKDGIEKLGIYIADKSTGAIPEQPGTEQNDEAPIPTEET
jgi:hypothetical protein